MAYTDLSFTSGDILTASEMNRLMDNFPALAVQDSGAPKIDVSCLFSNLIEADTAVFSDLRAGVASFGTVNATSASFANIDFDSVSVSDFIAGIGSLDIINVQSGNIESLIASDFRAGIGSVSNLHVGSAAIDNLTIADLELESLTVSALVADVASINTLTTSNLQTEIASVALFHAESANINDANIDNLTAQTLIVSDARIGIGSLSIAQIESANINNLNVVNLDIDSIITSDLQADIASINTLVVSIFQTDTASAAFLNAGVIEADCAAIIDFQAETAIVSDALIGVGSLSIAQIGSANIDNLNAATINAETLITSALQADIASFNTLVVSLFQSYIESTALLHANSGTIDDLTTTNILADLTSSNILHVECGEISDLIISSEFQARIGTVESLGVDDLTATNIIAANLQVDAASIGALNVESGEILNLVISSEFQARIGTVESLGIDDLTATNAIITNATIDASCIGVIHYVESAEISDLFISSEFDALIGTVNSLGVDDLTATNAFITDAVIDAASVGVLYYVESAEISDLVISSEFDAFIGTVDSLGVSDLTVTNILAETIIVSDARIGIGSLSIIHAGSANIDNLDVNETASFPNSSTGITQDSGTSDTRLATTEFVNEGFTGRGDWLQNGYVDQTQTTITFSDGNRLFTIEPTGASFEYFVQGDKFSVSAEDTVTITNVEGIHAIYYDDSTLTALANPSATQFQNLVLTKALTALVYWNVGSDMGVLYNERHGTNMAPTTHGYLHQVVNFAYISGLGLANFTIGDGSLNSHAQFSTEAGVCFDEDLQIDLDALDTTSQNLVFYRDGSDWRWREQDGFKCITFDGTASTRLAYDNSGVLTEVSNGDYALVHVFATNAESAYPISIVGQAEYPTIVAARNGAETEINDLVLSGLPSKELKPIASIIFQTRNTYANDVQSRIVQTDAGENYVDWRTTALAAGVSAADHGALGGLGDDDHTQYALLAGRSGGQTLIGGESAGDTLTLQSCGDVIVNDNLVVNSGLQADIISGSILGVGSGTILNFKAETLIASDARIGVGSINLLHSNSANIVNLEVSNLDIDAIVTSDIQADIGSINTLTVSLFQSYISSNTLFHAESGTIDDLTTTNIIATGILADAASLGTINVESGEISDLIVSSVFDAYIGTVESLGIDDLTVTNIIATNIQADVGSFGTINVECGEISDLIISSEFQASG